jgi:hypothetical protein
VKLPHALRGLVRVRAVLLGVAATLLAQAAAAQAAEPPPPAPASAPVAAPTVTPAATAVAPNLLLRAPAAADLSWRGMLATEGGAVGVGPQLGPYPAAGVGGLLVAIFTHAAITEGVKSSQQKRAQAEADAVLEPYLPLLKSWPAASLWDAVLAQAPADLGLAVAEVGQGPAQSTAVILVPSFALSQDEHVLIADVALRFEGGSVAATPVERLVRVVSSPLPTAEARTHWLADEAQALKRAAAAMVAHALQVGYRHISAAAGDLPTRTHRYLRGKAEGMERGQLLQGDCGRAVLLTLRGHLLSVPRAETEQTPCPRSVNF